MFQLIYYLSFTEILPKSMCSYVNERLVALTKDLTKNVDSCEEGFFGQLWRTLIGWLGEAEVAVQF